MVILGFKFLSNKSLDPRYKEKHAVLRTYQWRLSKHLNKERKNKKKNPVNIMNSNVGIKSLN
jgi:hypothetical protein